MATDYYEVLGINKDATRDEIKKAYKRLAKKHHPDVDKSADANEKFKEINEAYQVLSDEKKRAAYDQFGTDAFDQGRGFGGFGGQARSGQWGPFTYTYTTSGQAPDFDFADFSDPFSIFEQVFGSRGFGRQPRRGRNLYYTIQVDFMDAVNGLAQEVRLNGKKLKIKIPAGIRDGGQLKFAGEGEPGPQNMPPGDLYLTVRIQPHPTFTRIGDDIYILKEINFVQVALGDTIEVATVDKPVKLKIPAGTQSGTQFRLRGKGVLHLRGRGKGDQYVRVRVQVPQKLSREQKRLLEEFRDQEEL
jgi:molecular chaperone DnaJ